MEMICVSSFGRFGQIKGISFNKIYKVKYAHGGKLLITNDFGRPQMVRSDNFLNYNDVKNFF
jgi:hypothetical protein